MARWREEAVAAQVNAVGPLPVRLAIRVSKQVTRRKNLLASYKHWAMPIAAGGVFLALWIVAWGALMGAYAGRMNGVDIAAGGASVNQNVIPGKGRLSVDADIAACVLEHR